MKARIVSDHKRKGEVFEVARHSAVWFLLLSVPVGTVVEVRGVRYEKVES